MALQAHRRSCSSLYTQQHVPQCATARIPVCKAHKGCRRHAGTLHVRMVASTTTLSTEQNGSPPATASPTPYAEPQADSFSRSFNWLSYWYPVQVLANTDPSRPHALELLGKQLVLWRDGQGKWCCMEDACPHRLAPLSEGRLESDGTLQCSYHGWRFNSQGQCTEIPQAIDEKAKLIACSSSRSCVTSYPVREDCGLIWVWPSAGLAAAAEAAAAPTPLSKVVVGDWRSGKTSVSGWHRRELPYSWDVLVENLTDPSHLPFSHHNLSPSLKRSKGHAPMPFTAVDIPTGNTPADAAARPGYVMGHRAPLAAFEFPSAMSPSGRVTFTPPSLVTYEYNMGPVNTIHSEIIAVPAGPGRSVAYNMGRNDLPQTPQGDLIKTLFTNPKMLPIIYRRYMYRHQPGYRTHMMMNKLFDQDSLFLNMQDRQLAARGKSSWSKDYYMPTQADLLVIIGRKWADFALQLPLPSNVAGGNDKHLTAADAFSFSAAEVSVTRPVSQRDIGGRYNQHTKHCMMCQTAMKGFEQRLQLARAAAAGLAAAVIGVVAGWVVPGLFAAAAAGSPAAAAGSSAAAITVAAVLAAAALLAKRIADATAQTLMEFTYVDFSHADNH